LTSKAVLTKFNPLYDCIIIIGETAIYRDRNDEDIIISDDKVQSLIDDLDLIEEDFIIEDDKIIGTIYSKES
jgi:hypothetical protein